MVKTLDKQITISHAQRADAPQGKIFKLQEYQKKRINKWIGSDSLEHYGDETQYIVEAIAATIYVQRLIGMPSAWEADPIHLFIRFFVSLQQPKPYSSISKLRNSVKKRPCSSLVILTSISRLSILIRPAENSSFV